MPFRRRQTQPAPHSGDTGRQWTGAFLIDETWRLTPEQLQAIESALLVKGPRRSRRHEPKRCQAILSGIEEVLQHYRSYSKNEIERPLPGEDRKQLKACADAFSEAIDAIEHLTESARERIEDIDAQASFQRLQDILERHLKAIERFKPRGRPHSGALGILVNRLALIWEKVHGRRPGRAYKPDANIEDGPFNRFVLACLKTVDVNASCPNKIIRQTIKGWKMDLNRTSLES